MEAVVTTLPWTSADLEAFPDDGKLREIIDGELYVSTQPHWYHQNVCARVTTMLTNWSLETEAGEVSVAPGLVFADDDDVAPDVVWISQAQLEAALASDGKLHAAPELVVEVLSPGSANARRDRQAKLRLYSRRGVREYWLLDWRTRRLEVFRREGAILKPVATLYDDDTLTSPLLPGFLCLVTILFPKRRE